MAGRRGATDGQRSRGARALAAATPRRLLPTALLLGAIAALATVLAPAALACDCPEPPTPQEERDRVDVVFSGEVVAVTEPGADVDPPDRELVAEIDVDRVYAGEVQERVEVRTAGDQAMCGYGFETGRAELIYAVEDDGTLTTGLCSRTAPLERAEEDLAALGDGEPPRTGSGSQLEGGTDRQQPGWPLLLAAAGLVVVVLALAGWRVRRHGTG